MSESSMHEKLAAIIRNFDEDKNKKPAVLDAMDDGQVDVESRNLQILCVGKDLATEQTFSQMRNLLRRLQQTLPPEALESKFSSYNLSNSWVCSGNTRVNESHDNQEILPKLCMLMIIGLSKFTASMDGRISPVRSVVTSLNKLMLKELTGEIANCTVK
nr:HEAT repeat family protein, expressed [Tanacetum cinerariifolium]